MNPDSKVVRRIFALATLGLLTVLAGCAGTIKQDLRVKGDLSRLDGVSQVTAAMSPDAVKLQADNPQFSRDELATRLRNRLESRNLTAPAASHRVEIVVTDIRVRGAFAAIMFGFMAGDDHVTGVVRVVDASGRALRSFEVNANYAFGGVAGGQDSVRMNWLYDKFADLAAEQLEKVIVAPRAGAGPIGMPVATQPVAPAPSTPQAAPSGAAPGRAVVPMAALDVAIDNVDAVPVSERGRNAYRQWLAQKPPRAFVISENGWFYATWGTKPPDPMAPRDPVERAMKRCQDAQRPSCALYAVDDRIVYTRPTPTAAR